MGGGVQTPEIRAQTRDLRSPKPRSWEVRAPPSLDPLPLALRPLPPHPQPPAKAFLTFPSSSGPAGEDLIRRVANPWERPASSAAEPGARPSGGSYHRCRPRPAPGLAETPPGAHPRAHAGPSPSPRLPEPPGRREGPDARSAGDAGRAGPGQDAARQPVPPARPLRSLGRGRRQRRARRRCLRPPLPLRPRRRSAPLACPALLAFFPLPEGGEPSRAGGGAARGGGGGGRGPGEGGGERRELLPRPAAGAPQSLAL